MVGLILCIIGNYVCCYFASKYGERKKEYKNAKQLSNIFFVASIILSIVAAVLIINLIDSNSKGVGAAKYTYYVNGKKVSSASYAATENFFIGFMIFGLLFGSGMGLSAGFVNKKDKVKKEKKPSVPALIFSCFSIIFGISLIISGISALTHHITSNSNITPYIALFLSVVFILLGIWGITTFIKRKRLKNEKK